MRSHAELKKRRVALSRTWEHLLAGGRDVGPANPADGPLLESWRRSAEHVSPDVQAAPVDDPEDVVQAWQESPVAAGLREVVREVRQVADDADLVVALTDPTGRITWTHGSPVMSRAAARVNFVPGGRWDEASVGTNALALALRTGAPSTVYSAEHFSRAVHEWVCYSVPLTDPDTRDVLGVLDLSTTWDRAHPLSLGTAQALSRLVTETMPRQRRPSAAQRLDLTILGSWQVRLGGRLLLLPRRQVEVLLLLALHPEGLSLESLHARLYGDDPVSTGTLKAEVSHLRTALCGGIGSRPYRLLLEVDSDLQRALAALDRGALSAALTVATGPLLPGSESPDVGEWRRYVDVALRSGALASDDVTAVRTLADLHPYDEKLAEHLVALLDPTDPRLAGATARLQRTRDADDRRV